GIDTLAETICSMLDHDLQLVILGTGEVWANFFFGDLPKRWPNKCGCYIGYDNALAHKIEAGADFFLMPSRFEPCGLNQLYSLKYGTLPIVRAVGGLNDTVDNLEESTQNGTGFKFHDLTAAAISNTIGWALYIYYNRKDILTRMIKQAMNKNFSWQDSASKYVEIYNKALHKKRGY
ncbi:glycogen/starch synthase, partial [Candidatus Magnetoovum chiemensis]